MGSSRENPCHLEVSARHVPGSPSEQAWVDGKRVARMDGVDRMSSEHRELVHDYGLNVVNSMLAVGVTKPRHIRHLVETILNEFSPTRGSYSAQGPRLYRDGDAQ